MFYTILNTALESWNLWCAMFKSLPYGDPYIATLALFVIFATTSKLLAGGETT
ncbi:MAG: hypothetical protein HQ512_10350 [Rhodospirillales bacterium]|nr:hypothetical protein [Rhodospirillales bacterium]